MAHDWYWPGWPNIFDGASFSDKAKVYIDQHVELALKDIPIDYEKNHKKFWDLYQGLD